MSAPVAGAPNLTVIDAVTQFVGGTQTVWNSVTIPIPAGLVVYAVDTTVIKIGDGITLYANLPVLFTLNTLLATLIEMNAFLSGNPGFATLAEVMTSINAALMSYVTTQDLTSALSVLSDYARLDSPNFTGTPTAPTPPIADSSTRLATTNFVTALVATISLSGGGGGLTSEQVAAAINAAMVDYATVAALAAETTRATTAELSKAAEAGTATQAFSMATAAPGTSTTQGATTEFVMAAVSALDGGTVSASRSVGPGTYYVDTSAGSITLTLSATLSGAYTFVDAAACWSDNHLTIDGNGHTIGNISTNTASTFLADVSDCEFSIVATGTYWRLV
jgi:hypothetical protein